MVENTMRGKDNRMLLFSRLYLYTFSLLVFCPGIFLYTTSIVSLFFFSSKQIASFAQTYS